jgi:hypothetical protein
MARGQKRHESSAGLLPDLCVTVGPLSGHGSTVGSGKSRPIGRPGSQPAQANARPNALFTFSKGPQSITGAHRPADQGTPPIATILPAHHDHCVNAVACRPRRTTTSTCGAGNEFDIWSADVQSVGSRHLRTVHRPVRCGVEWAMAPAPAARRRLGSRVPHARRSEVDWGLRENES